MTEDCFARFHQQPININMRPAHDEVIFACIIYMQYTLMDRRLSNMSELQVTLSGSGSEVAITVTGVTSLGKGQRGGARRSSGKRGD